MKKLKYALLGSAGALIIGLGTMGIASAATPGSTNLDVGSSGIPRTVFRQEKLDATATVLDTTTAKVQAAVGAKDLKQLISSAGLTKLTFREKVRAQLTTNLENDGYSQNQVTIALQHKTIHYLRHHRK